MNGNQRGPSGKTIARRIAALVKAKRIKENLSKSECGRQLNMPRQRYTEIERGVARLYVDEIEKIMTVFSIKAEQIWPEFAQIPPQAYKLDVRAEAGKRVLIIVNLVDSLDRK